MNDAAINDMLASAYAINDKILINMAYVISWTNTCPRGNGKLSRVNLRVLEGLLALKPEQYTYPWVDKTLVDEMLASTFWDEFTQKALKVFNFMHDKIMEGVTV